MKHCKWCGREITEEQDSEYYGCCSDSHMNSTEMIENINISNKYNTI